MWLTIGKSLISALGLASRTALDSTMAEALFASVCELGLEGVVAKKHASRYRAGQRGWVKVKNPTYWRRESEVEGVRRSQERKRARV